MVYFRLQERYDSMITRLTAEGCSTARRGGNFVTVKKHCFFSRAGKGNSARRLVGVAGDEIDAHA